MRFTPIAVLAACAMVIAAEPPDPASAAGGKAFALPDQSVRCVAHVRDDDRPSIYCDWDRTDDRAVRLHADGRARLVKAGGALGRGIALPYNRTRRFGALHCTSLHTGMRCWNRRRYGFQVRRGGHPLLFPTVLARGDAEDGSEWRLQDDDATADPTEDVCLSLVHSLPTGSMRVGHTCAFGSLAAHGDAVVVVTWSRGEDASNLVGGATNSRARVVRVHFADGRQLRMRARRWPGSGDTARSLRFFAGNATAVTTTRPRVVTVYDARGRRIAEQRLYI